MDALPQGMGWGSREWTASHDAWRFGLGESANILDNLAKLAADPEFQMVPPKGALVDLSPLALRKRQNNSRVQR